MSLAANLAAQLKPWTGWDGLHQPWVGSNMAGNYTLTVYCGETLTRSMTWRLAGVPVDLTGYSAAITARSVGFPGGDILFTWASPSQISLSSLGVIAITVSAYDTASLWGAGHHRYVGLSAGRGSYHIGDYELNLSSPSSIVYRLLQGDLIVVPSLV